SMNQRDIRVVFLYQWQSGHNAAAGARNVNTAYGDGFVNELTIRHWYTKFECGDE
ncbi:hypothetical protein Angca_003844, partial [Angiostrongylus cantonensis]